MNVQRTINIASINWLKTCLSGNTCNSKELEHTVYIKLARCLTTLMVKTRVLGLVSELSVDVEILEWHQAFMKCNFLCSKIILDLKRGMY